MKNSLINKSYLFLGVALTTALMIFSFIGYFLPFTKNWLALVLCLILFFLAARDLFWGLALLLSELSIGGHGYLIAFSLNGFNLAIRHLFFGIILLIFFYQIIFKKITFTPPRGLLKGLFYLGFIWFLAVFIGYLNGRSLTDIFYDSNAYLFFLIALPLIKVLADKGLKPMINIIFGGLITLAAQTLLTLFIFSHQLDLASVWYLWVRDLRFGEITYVGASFYRVFFQSQVFLLLALFIITAYVIKNYSNINKEEGRTIFILSVLYLSSFILALSRSFFFAVSSGGLMLLILLIKDKEILTINIFKTLKVGGFTLLTAFILLTSMQSQLFGVGIFLNRLDKSESAVLSRWALLPKMVTAIKEGNIIFGSGFGSKITYQSNDPRILAESKGTGEYSTFSFEWGYLDIILKMGVAGIISWFLIFAYLYKNMFQQYLLSQKNYLWLGIISAETALIAAHIFTPYLNHPLGITFLALGF